MQCTWLCPKPGGTVVASVNSASICGDRRRSACYCGLDRGNVDLAHRHHRLECTAGHARVRAVDRLDQHFRGDLPGHAPAVLAPAAVAFLAAVADDGVPVAVGFGLVGGGDLEREGLGLLEDRASVKADAGNAEDGELDGEDVAGLAGREVARGMEDPSN